MLTVQANQWVLGHVQDSGRALVSVSVLTPALYRARFSRKVDIRCFGSPAPALVVPCTPVPAGSSLSECLVDHLLHGICPNVMTLGEPTRNGGFLDQGGMTADETALDSFYVFARIARDAYEQSSQFLTLGEGYGLSNATWEPM